MKMYSILNKETLMNKIEKEVYKTPIIMKQQVILEQVIAAGSTTRSTSSKVQENWTEIDVEGDYLITL